MTTNLKINPQRLRDQSTMLVESLGYAFNATLPLLDSSLSIRSKNDAIDRALTLFVVVAVATGAKQDKALDWLEREGLENALTRREAEWLNRKDERRTREFAAQEESLLALAWALGVVEVLDFARPCDTSLARAFPRARDNETSLNFRGRAAYRSPDEIAAAVDLAYCIHWAIRNERFSNVRNAHRVDEYVVEERRRALEWLTSEDDWDEVCLDT
jgi:hypothetical protein